MFVWFAFGMCLFICLIVFDNIKAKKRSMLMHASMQAGQLNNYAKKPLLEEFQQLGRRKSSLNKLLPVICSGFCLLMQF